MHRPIHHLSIAVKGELPASILGDGDHIEIDIVLQPAIQTQLISTGALAASSVEKSRKSNFTGFFSL